MLKGKLCPLPDMQCLGQREPGAQGKNLWLLAVCSPQVIISYNSEPVYIEFWSSKLIEPQAATGARRQSGALMWTCDLTATLRVSPSHLLSHPWLMHWPWAIVAWVSFLRCNEVPRSALPSGLFLSQRLSDPRGQRSPCHSVHSAPDQSVHDHLLSLLDISALKY